MPTYNIRPAVQLTDTVDYWRQLTNDIRFAFTNNQNIYLVVPVTAGNNTTLTLPANAFGTFRLCIKTSDTRQSVRTYTFMTNSTTLYLSSSLDLLLDVDNLTSSSVSGLNYNFVPVTSGTAYISYVYELSP